MTGAREQMTLALTGIVDLNGVDPIQDPLVAASGGSQGNGLDQTLDTLGAKLALAQVTLADVDGGCRCEPRARWRPSRRCCSRRPPAARA